MSRLDVYISRYGDFCAHDDNDNNNDNNDTTDYFTPCTCARGNNSVTSAVESWGGPDEVYRCMYRTVVLGQVASLTQGKHLTT